MNEAQNNQFNRTGPVVLNNRPPLADPSGQMYHHIPVGPTSTKSGHAADRAERADRDQRGGHFTRNSSKDVNKLATSNKGGSSRGPSTGQRNPSTNHSQQMANPARMAGGSSGSGQGMLNVKLSKKQHSTTLDSHTNDQERM